MIQTPPFQRLRRIRQLGFSEFVFPGATHGRFAHSLGVFHTARQLMRVVKSYVDSHGQQFRDSQAEYSLSAALLHDVGHGMFSHAFEALGKEFRLADGPSQGGEPEAEPRDSEIAQILDKEFGGGYGETLRISSRKELPATTGPRFEPFDADQLHDRQRDRLMTGDQRQWGRPNIASRDPRGGGGSHWR